MQKIIYQKIVRDNIPAIIENSGKTPVYEYVDSQAAIAGLEEKLTEELQEYLESHTLEELADLLEVMHGILYNRGIAWEALEEIRLRKKRARGGFEKGVRLISVEEPS